MKYDHLTVVIPRQPCYLLAGVCAGGTNVINQPCVVRGVPQRPGPVFPSWHEASPCYILIRWRHPGGHSQSVCS
jgi:hypothetical protein